MDLLSILGIMRRKWHVVVPTLVLTLGAAVAVNSLIPPEYQASGWVILEPPELDPADLPSAQVSVLELADDLREEGPSGIPGDADFVVQGVGEEGAFLLLVSASTSDAVVTATTRLVDMLIDRVEQVQEEAGVDSPDRLQLRRAEPRVIPEPQADGSFSAQFALELRDPASEMANPYGANAGTGRLLVVAATGDSGSMAFRERVGSGITFAVTQTDRDTAPLLGIVTTGSDPDRVVGAFDDVREILNEDLDQRQERARVPEAGRVTVEPFDPPLGATEIGPPIDRATAAVVLLGGLLAVGLAIGLHSLEVRREGAPNGARILDRPDPPPDEPREHALAREPSGPEPRQDVEPGGVEATQEATTDAQTGDRPGPTPSEVLDSPTDTATGQLAWQPTDVLATRTSDTGTSQPTPTPTDVPAALTGARTRAPESNGGAEEDRDQGDRPRPSWAADRREPEHSDVSERDDDDDGAHTDADRPWYQHQLGPRL